jgi:N-acetyl-alpha-D-glucosaminyl L-malate synthase BshA
VKIGITCYPTYGGSGAVATELGIALAARGHEVHFITYSQPFRLPNFLPRIFFHEVEVNRYPLFEYPPYDLALAVRMHEVTRAQGLDVLHCHYAIPHATSAWIAREMLRAGGDDVPVMTTLHGTDITIVGQDPSFHAITKFSIERSDVTTAVSEFLRRETIATFGCATCDVVVVPNFIDPAMYDRARHPPALSWLVPRGRKVIMHVSNMRAVKRVRDVVQVFARITREVPSVLFMVGDGPERTDAEREARSSASSARCTSSESSRRWRRCSPEPTCSSCRARASRSGSARSRRSPRACRSVASRAGGLPRWCRTA